MPILSSWNKAKAELERIRKVLLEERKRWERASLEQKELIVRRLNGETGIRWPFPVPPIREFGKGRERAQQRLQVALPAGKHLTQQVRADRKLFVEHHARIGWFQEWSYGVNLPPDIRRCAYEKCSRLFLVGARSEKKYCRPVPCGRNVRVARFQNGRNRRIRKADVKRVRAVMKRFAGLPDGKIRTALKAHVKVNFVSYLIRRGEIPDLWQ